MNSFSFPSFLKLMIGVGNLMSRMITLAFYATHRREENGLYTKFTSIVVGGRGGGAKTYV